MPHHYTFGATGPMVHYEDCEFLGAHQVTTGSATPAAGSVNYEGCRFINASTVAAALRVSNAKTAPLRTFARCWLIPDTTT